MTTPGPLADRVALVTGASRGIGAALSLALAEAGAHVIAVARTVGGLEELDDRIRKLGRSATLVPLDVTDMDALDRLGAAIHERWRKLDVFVANAGILGPLSPLGHVEPRAFEAVMATNVTATWRMIRSFDPLLRASEAGRAVLISSGAAHSCRAYWGPYSLSKAAIEALGRTYAAETATTPIKVMLVNPGPVRTRMRAEAMPGEDPMTLPTPETIASAILPLCLPAWQESGALFDVPQGRVLAYRRPE
jgi:NAD(P)-dependent dehydrogenase (short-subunit alcohol dehydrogenase family)